jgi:hypothetical protein
MKKLLLTLAILFSFAANVHAAALIGAAFGNISGVGGALNAGKQATNTLYVNGVTLSKVGGKPTLTITTGVTDVTAVTGTSPVISSGGTTPAISMPAATNSVSGYMTSADHTTLSTALQAGGTLGIANGGTGATTAPAALTALGASPLAGSSSLNIIGPLASDATIHGITVGRGSGNISTNTATGSDALYSNTTGNNNTANGFNALYTNGTGSNNTANGFDALFSTTTGGNNTATGYSALFSTTTGVNDTTNGSYALSNNTTGSYNTAFGYQAGEFISGGSVALTAPSGSLFLGSGTEALADGDAGETVIGYGAIGHGSNTTTIGGPSTVKTYITGTVSVNSGSTVVYYCNGGTNSGLMGRGNGGPCVGGSWVATSLTIN